jgi:hypothetical protein
VLDIHATNMNLDTGSLPFTKMDTDLNIKHKTRELLEDDIEENLYNLAYGDDLLQTTPETNINKLDFTNIKIS